MDAEKNGDKSLSVALGPGCMCEWRGTSATLVLQHSRQLHNKQKRVQDRLTLWHAFQMVLAANANGAGWKDGSMALNMGPAAGDHMAGGLARGHSSSGKHMQIQGLAASYLMGRDVLLQASDGR